MTIQDHYEDTYSDKTEPSLNCFAVAPDDNALLPEVARALTVNASGMVTFVLLDQSAPVDVYMAAGAIYPGRYKQVLATGTDATGIRAWA